MSAILMPTGKLRYHAYIDGVYGPAVGYKLYTYAAGTTTPKATYADAAATTPLANPIVLDARGECAPYGTGSYKLLLTDPNGATVTGWPQDNVTLSSSVASEEWCGTAGGTANALTLSPTVGVSAYLPGQRFSFVVAYANSGAVTVNVSGVGTVALTKKGNSALEANDLVVGRLHQMQFDGVRFQLANDTLANLTTTAPAITDDSNRVVTSEWVKDLTASDTRAGISELLTAAEFSTGTDPLRVMTAALFGTSKSGSAASITLPGGLIIKTGLANAATSSAVQTINFATPFPNACISVVFTTDIGDVGSDSAAMAAGYTRMYVVTPSGFGLAYTARTRFWIAVGY